jgi:hypothetical protein
MALSDDPKKERGTPKTSHIDENCVLVQGLIRVDRRVNVREIAELTSIVKSTVFEIVSDLRLNSVPAAFRKSPPRSTKKENNNCFL